MVGTVRADGSFKWFGKKGGGKKLENHVELGIFFFFFKGGRS